MSDTRRLSIGEHCRNGWLDGLRACAALLVVIGHAISQLSGWGWLLGFWGVELFFVLSGFLVGGILYESYCRDPNVVPWLRDFWLRRWLRTLPNYYLFLFIYAAVWVHVQGWTSPPVAAYALFAQNLAWPHPGFFPVAWSLAVEEIFYLFFPILILVASRIGLRKPLPLFALCGAIVIAASAAARAWVHLGPSFDEHIRKVVVFRLDAIMVGLLAYLYFRHAASSEASSCFSAGWRF